MPAIAGRPKPRLPKGRRGFSCPPQTGGLRPDRRHRACGEAAASVYLGVHETGSRPHLGAVPRSRVLVDAEILWFAKAGVVLAARLLRRAATVAVRQVHRKFRASGSIRSPVVLPIRSRAGRFEIASADFPDDKPGSSEYVEKPIHESTHSPARTAARARGK